MGFMAAASLVIGAFNVVSSYSKAKAQQQQATEDRKSAYRAGSIDLGILNNQIQQMVTSSGEQQLDREKQGERDRARILTAAGESNISGNTVMRMMAANMNDESRDKGIYKENLERGVSQNAMEAYKVKANASTNASYASGSRINPYLQAINTGAQSYLNYQGTKQRMNNK